MTSALPCVAPVKYAFAEISYMVHLDLSDLFSFFFIFFLLPLARHYIKSTFISTCDKSHTVILPSNQSILPDFSFLLSCIFLVMFVVALIVVLSCVHGLLPILRGYFTLCILWPPGNWHILIQEFGQYFLTPGYYFAPMRHSLW